MIDMVKNDGYIYGENVRQKYQNLLIKMVAPWVPWFLVGKFG